MSQPDELLAVSLSELSAIVLAERTVDEILGTVVGLARDTVDGADGVSVSLAVGDRLTTSHATDDLVRELDGVQYREGDGPCVDAIRKGRRISLSVDEEPNRYPSFSTAAQQHFITGVLSNPLAAGERVLGGLNCYSASVSRFGERDAQVASRFARQASVVLANALSLEDATATNDQLHEALLSRDVIGQAKGILMERRRCSADEAFDVLRRASQRQNRKLTAIAQDVVGGSALDDG